LEWTKQTRAKINSQTNLQNKTNYATLEKPGGKKPVEDANTPELKETINRCVEESSNGNIEKSIDMLLEACNITACIENYEQGRQLYTYLEKYKQLLIERKAVDREEFRNATQNGTIFTELTHLLVLLEDSLKHQNTYLLGGALERMRACYSLKQEITLHQEGRNPGREILKYRITGEKLQSLLWQYGTEQTKFYNTRQHYNLLGETYALQSGHTETQSVLVGINKTEYGDCLGIETIDLDALNILDEKLTQTEGKNQLRICLLPLNITQTILEQEKQQKYRSSVILPFNLLQREETLHTAVLLYKEQYKDRNFETCLRAAERI